MLRKWPAVALACAAVGLLLVSGCAQDAEDTVGVGVQATTSPDGSGTETLAVTIPQQDSSTLGVTGTAFQAALIASAPPSLTLQTANTTSDPMRFEWVVPFKDIASLNSVMSKASRDFQPVKLEIQGNPFDHTYYFEDDNQSIIAAYFPWVVPAKASVWLNSSAYDRTAVDQGNVFGTWSEAVLLPNADHPVQSGGGGIKAISAQATGVGVSVDTRSYLFALFHRTITFSTKQPMTQAQGGFVTDQGPNNAWHLSPATAPTDVSVSFWAFGDKALLAKTRAILGPDADSPITLETVGGSWLKPRVQISEALDSGAWLNRPSRDAYAQHPRYQWVHFDQAVSTVHVSLSGPGLSAITQDDATAETPMIATELNPRAVGALALAAVVLGAGGERAAHLSCALCSRQCRSR